MPNEKPDAPTPPVAPVRQSVEAWQRAKHPGVKPELDWQHRAAAALNRWVVGEELTEAEYDAARAAAANLKLGY